MEVTESELLIMNHINDFFKIYKPIPPIFYRITTFANHN